MMTLFDRITFNPNVMGGRACIRDLRVTVALRYAAWLSEENIYETEALAA
jgi:hypothetical protein